MVTFWALLERVVQLFLKLRQVKAQPLSVQLYMVEIGLFCALAKFERAKVNKNKYFKLSPFLLI